MDITPTNFRNGVSGIMNGMQKDIVRMNDMLSLFSTLLLSVLGLLTTVDVSKGVFSLFTSEDDNTDGIVLVCAIE